MLGSHFALVDKACVGSGQRLRVFVEDLLAIACRHGAASRSRACSDDDAVQLASMLCPIIARLQLEGKGCTLLNTQTPSFGERVNTHQVVSLCWLPGTSIRIYL